jgi:hypothetical protein
MKAERNIAANTLRGTLLLRMPTLGTLAKVNGVVIPEGSLPSSLTKRYFDYQKTKGAGSLASQGSCPLLHFSRFLL